MVGLGNRGVYPWDLSKHLAHTLRASGYQTVTFGIEDNHLGLVHIGKGSTFGLGKYEIKN